MILQLKTLLVEKPSVFNCWIKASKGTSVFWLLIFFLSDSSVQQPKVTALFTHSTAFDQFLVALDANKDDTPLTAENYEQMKDRKWRVSKFGMFATNIATVLYK